MTNPDYPSAWHLAEQAKWLAEAEAARTQSLRNLAGIALLEMDLAVRTAEAARARAETEQAEITSRAARLNEQYRDACNDEHRSYQFLGNVDDVSVGNAYDTLTAWHRIDAAEGNKDRPYTITFSSPGGAVMPGFRLYDHLTELKVAGHHLTTRVRGAAMSMGATLLQAGDVRIMGAESVLLIHELSGGVQGKGGEIADTLALMKILTDRVLGIYAKRTALTAAEIKRRWSRTDWWLSSEDALKYGFVDVIG